MHKPIIAAINGYAVGGGFSLASPVTSATACRPRSSAAPKCAGRTWRRGSSYICQLPTGWAYWFALSGQMIDADTAFRLGLVQKICEPDKLLDDCIELRHDDQPQRPPDRRSIPWSLSKTNCSTSIQGWEKGFEVHREFYAHLRQSKDYDEGSAAFSERRKPEFSQEFYDAKTKPPGVPDPVKSSGLSCQ